MKMISKTKILPIVAAMVWLSGCGQKSQSPESVNYSAERGEKLSQAKCSRCHNTAMPPVTSETEKAPPLYTVTVHLKDWMKVSDPSQKREKFIAFVQDYVIHPSRKKSYCDPASLKTYGVMPSQKGKVTQQELGDIAAFMYDTYDQMAMLQAVKEQQRLAKLPPYRQVLETHDCLLCHRGGKLAPSFAQIGKRYGMQGIKRIEEAILKGSKGRWPSYHTPMRAYKDLSEKQLEDLARWIAQGAKE